MTDLTELDKAFKAAGPAKGTQGIKWGEAPAAEKAQTETELVAEEAEDHRLWQEFENKLESDKALAYIRDEDKAARRAGAVSSMPIPVPGGEINFIYRAIRLYLSKRPESRIKCYACPKSIAHLDILPPLFFTRTVVGALALVYNEDNALPVVRDILEGLIEAGVLARSPRGWAKQHYKIDRALYTKGPEW